MIGQYRVLSLLGEGGMGVVYRGEHVVLGRQAAIKVLLPHVAREAVLVQRFINEARVAANMHHRNIVDVLDCGTFATPTAPEGQWFIALEFLEGKSLASFIADHAGQPIDIATIIHVLGEAANGLHAAHERHQLVHRDVKPDNLYLTQTEDDPIRVKVLDFGIAKLRQQSNGVQTRSQTVMGTPAYAAPEQMRDSKEVDARADVWALGVIAHEMITGVRPWGSTTSVWEIIAKQSALRKAPDPREFRPDTPERVAAVISRAMEPDPDRRWTTAKEFACALAEAGSMPYSVNGMAILDRYAPELTRASSHSPTIGRSTPEPLRAAPPEIITSRERPMIAAQPHVSAGSYPPSSPGQSDPARPISTFAASAGQSVASAPPHRGRGLVLALGVVGLAAVGIVAVVVFRESPSSTATQQAERSADAGANANVTQSDAASRMAALAVVTSPDGSYVFVDGVEKGRTPLNLELPVGNKVEVRTDMPGYASASRIVTIEPTPTTIRIDLVPLVDAGTTTTPAESTVTKQPPKRRTGSHEQKRNPREPGPGSGAGSNQGFSPNDVL
jgi:eukaryotic-like serine/threonine-protein kinase